MKNKIFELLSKIFRKNKKYFKDFFGKVWEIIKKPEMMVLPGHLAFFIIMSFVPLISIVTWIGSLMGVTEASFIEFLEQIFSTVKFDWIVPNIIGQEFSFKYLTVILVMCFIAANGANSIIVASNQIYGIKQKSVIKREIKAIVMTILLCVLYIFILLVPLLGNKIISSFDYFNIKAVLDPILAVIRGPITWIVIYYFVKSIYVMAPDKNVDHKGFNLGALFTTVFWVLATYLYSGWINNFNRYDMYYGSLSSLAILMLWIYWLCYIFVIGLCLNVKVENHELEKTGIINNET
ncbi:MAG: YihY/virulence factor BrkB family protein [Bacilli bacterium]|nr:YihY/virulence factor BrkB family protein [Bacilli bacterium]